MHNHQQNIRYFLYARKSSESEDRQVQSIEDQVKWLTALARNLGLNIKEVFQEAKSAKAPYIRPIFAEMIKRIQKGGADGILCWQINRLFRNPVDYGQISWLLQQGIIKSIQTIDRQYLPGDVLLLSVESGQANQFIVDLRKNVIRGMEGKAERGWLPHLAPLGYLNDKVNNIIGKDPERFFIVRKMWDLMLTGNYTASQILRIANKEWGLRTRKFKRIGGKELSRSGIYAIFSNQFYTGIVEFRGKQYKGKHEPMITLEEYDRVQVLFGRKGKPRPQTHEFAYTGVIRCQECGCLITAETKKKFIKTTNTIKEYTYYHCTRRKKDVVCSQKKVVREDNLELQIEQELAHCTILPIFLEWALGELERRKNNEVHTQNSIIQTQQQTLAETEKELTELTRMRYRDLITDEVFIKECNLLGDKINRLKEKLEKPESDADQWLELSKKTFQFATYARIGFLKGDKSTKKEILLGLGQNHCLKNQKLSIQAYEWLNSIQNDYPPLEQKYVRLEPAGRLDNKRKTEALASIRTRWWT